MRDWTVRQVAVAVVGWGARYHRRTILQTQRKNKEDIRVMTTSDCWTTAVGESLKNFSLTTILSNDFKVIWLLTYI